MDTWHNYDVKINNEMKESLHSCSKKMSDESSEYCAIKTCNCGL